MDSTWFWIAAFVAAIVILVVIVIIVEISKPIVIVNNNNQDQQPASGTLFSVCNNTGCNSGLVCTTLPGQPDMRCLIPSGGQCVDNIQCSSQVCIKASPTSVGVCQPANPGGGGATGSQIYCFQNGTWVASVTIPNGISFRRITGSGVRLLGIGRDNNAYLYTTENGWQNITQSITTPGILVDGMILANQIWLVYRISSGATLLYQLVNGALVPVNSGNTASGGLQLTEDNQPIEIQEIDVHTSLDIFLVGRVQGGVTSIYRRSNGNNFYRVLTIGENIYVMPLRTANNFAFSSNNSILLLGDFSTRIDNISGIVNDLIVSPDGAIWYLVNNMLYRGTNTSNTVSVTTPFTITPGSSLFYSEVYGVCVVRTI